jgi:hypothetical protein
VPFAGFGISTSFNFGTAALGLGDSAAAQLSTVGGSVRLAGFGSSDSFDSGAATQVFKELEIEAPTSLMEPARRNHPSTPVLPVPAVKGQALKAAVSAAVERALNQRERKADAPHWARPGPRVIRVVWPRRDLCVREGLNSRSSVLFTIFAHVRHTSSAKFCRAYS